MRRERAFVAGASGAVGEVLCRLLLADGWHVVGTTRSAEKASYLRKLGVEPAIVDVYDRDALAQAAIAARPDVVVHQLTDLPKHYTPEAMATARIANARIREVGTQHLVAAAAAAGAKRIVAQSIAFAYAPGALPHDEDAPLDASMHAAVIALEQQVLRSGLDAVVLRYGRLYGPNTWTMQAPDTSPVHVEAAADAARIGMTLGAPGIYNIVEDGAAASNAKAKRELGWSPHFRLSLR